MTSTDHPPVGIDHPTVVPGNFDPEERRLDDERSEQGAGTSGGAERDDSADERLTANERPEWVLSGR